MFMNVFRLLSRIMSLELSMSGIDVEIKRDTNKKKPLGK